MPESASTIPMPPMAAIGDYIAGSLGSAAQFDIVNGLIFALTDVTKRTAKSVQAFANSVMGDVEGMGSELSRVHEEIAKKAQAAIVTAYTKGLLDTPTYRTEQKNPENKRYAGGVLLRILMGNFVTADQYGVYVGDVAKLNAEAKQWARLNYGTAPRGSSPQRWQVPWSNLTVTLSEPGASRPGFSLPPGRWIGNEFYPISELPENTGTGPRSTGRHRSLREGAPRGGSWTPTRGIRGTHWLGAGLEVVALSMVTAYEELFRKMWKNAADEARRNALSAGSGLVKPTKFANTSVSSL